MADLLDHSKPGRKSPTNDKGVSVNDWLWTEFSSIAELRVDCIKTDKELHSNFLGTFPKFCEQHGLEVDRAFRNYLSMNRSKFNKNALVAGRVTRLVSFPVNWVLHLSVSCRNKVFTTPYGKQLSFDELLARYDKYGLTLSPEEQDTLLKWQYRSTSMPELFLLQ